MSSNLYFVIASALSAANEAPNYTRRVLAGQFNEACVKAAISADTNVTRRNDNHAAMLIYGDIQLALGRLMEAEETFRKAQRLIRDSRDAMRIISCRNAGWLAPVSYTHLTLPTKRIV